MKSLVQAFVIAGAILFTAELVSFVFNGKGIYENVFEEEKPLSDETGTGNLLAIPNSYVAEEAFDAGAKAGSICGMAAATEILTSENLKRKDDSMEKMEACINEKRADIIEWSKR